MRLAGALVAIPCLATFVTSAISGTETVLGRAAVRSEEAPRVSAAEAPAPGNPGALGTVAHEQAVMASRYCASCHPDAYAEHEQNTHGRAFTDEEVRLATGRFSQADCIICHTPRPIFETGIDQNPIRRHYDLEEGNSCMTCHWKEGQDYSRFQGGQECKSAFDPRVGSVEACASCHRNHGTPFQWEKAKNGKLAGNVCVDCHMPIVQRPPAVGEKPRAVHSHAFPASRSDSQLRRAFDYDAKVDGNEAVVTITNKGAGHNFPTELKQRSVESLVVVRDAEGKEVARSRMTFRDPYKRPYGLQLPINTQIPSGEQREHRVPIATANGTVTCELHYKLYYPIEDNHPDLARRLEAKTLAFSGLVPSTKPLVSEPGVAVVTPEGISAERAGPANLVDYAHPPIGKVEVDVPTGNSPADIDQLIALFQFPVPQANAEARKKLIAIGAPAVPKLVATMGSWDNKTWNQAMAVLEKIGEPAVPAVIAALDHAELYVRLHAAELLARNGWKGTGDAVSKPLRASLARPNALDREVAASTLADLGFADAAPELRKLLTTDRDPDVVRACALGLAKLGDEGSIDALKTALTRFEWPETRRDVASALARLGDASGIPTLLAGLDFKDDLIRESCFEAFFDVTGQHFCYDPLAPRDERLESLARLTAWWVKDGGAGALRHPMKVPAATAREVRTIAETFGGSDGSVPAGDDKALHARILDIGNEAVPGLARLGLKSPPGFSAKRAQICAVLGELRHDDAVPALVATLRDPVIGVAAWACDALAKIGDKTALPAVQRYHHRLLSLVSLGTWPPSAGSSDTLVAQAAAARFRLGDERIESDLVGYLLAEDEVARGTALAALRDKYGLELEYDSKASRDERRAAVQRWQSEHRP